MARLAVGAVFGVVVGIVAGAALGIRAQPDELEAAALEAGVDATDLAGAVNTTGLGPREYLQSTGELEPPKPPPGVWDRLAACESGQRWNISTGNGFYGGLQFDRQTWLAYGGGAYAPTANLASRAQQIAVAERLRAVRGFQPWPACSRRLGLR